MAQKKDETQFTGQQESSINPVEDKVATDTNNTDINGETAGPQSDSQKEKDEGTERPMLPSIIQWFKDLTLAAAICILIIVFVIQPFKVEKTSMEPLLYDGDRILVSKISLWFERIKRGDIVVLMNPRNTNESWIKRVIALPGETVQMDNGIFYINGEPLEEDYIPDIETTSKNVFPPPDVVRFADGFQGSSSEHTFEEFGIVYMNEWETKAGFTVALRVPDGYYFVVGDHRRYSMDSRDSVHIRSGNGPGIIPEKYIYGKAVFRYWPLDNFGGIEHPDYQQGSTAEQEVSDR